MGQHIKSQEALGHNSSPTLNKIEKTKSGGGGKSALPPSNKANRVKGTLMFFPIFVFANLFKVGKTL